MKYYLVDAKCGHVGARKYIVKTFPVVASSKSEAAAKIKRCNKVKKHLKDCIINVVEVTLNEFLIQKEMNLIDKYLHSHCKSEIIEIINSDLIQENINCNKKYKSRMEFECRKQKVDFYLKKMCSKEVCSYEYAY